MGEAVSKRRVGRVEGVRECQTRARQHTRFDVYVAATLCPRAPAVSNPAVAARREWKRSVDWELTASSVLAAAAAALAGSVLVFASFLGLCSFATLLTVFVLVPLTDSVHCGRGWQGLKRRGRLWGGGSWSGCAR